MFSMSKEILSATQIIFGGLLIFLVLIQQKGTGLGSTFGSEISFYHTRRGVEKLLFYATIGVAFLFLASSVLNLLLA